MQEQSRVETGGLDKVPGTVASPTVPGLQPTKAMIKVQVPNGPGYERLVNRNVLRFAQDGTS